MVLEKRSVEKHLWTFLPKNMLHFLTISALIRSFSLSNPRNQSLIISAQYLQTTFFVRFKHICEQDFRLPRTQTVLRNNICFLRVSFYRQGYPRKHSISVFLPVWWVYLSDLHSSCGSDPRWPKKPSVTFGTAIVIKTKRNKNEFLLNFFYTENLKRIFPYL